MLSVPQADTGDHNGDKNQAPNPKYVTRIQVTVSCVKTWKCICLRSNSADFMVIPPLCVLECTILISMLATHGTQKM